MELLDPFKEMGTVVLVDVLGLLDTAKEVVTVVVMGVLELFLMNVDVLELPVPSKLVCTVGVMVPWWWIC